MYKKWNSRNNGVKIINLVQFLMKMSTKYSLRKDIFNRCEITHEFLGSGLICLFSHTPVLHSFHSANEITSIGLCVHIPHHCTTPWSQSYVFVIFIPATYSTEINTHASDRYCVCVGKKRSTTFAAWTSTCICSMH